MPRTKKNKDVSKQTEGQAEPTTLRPWKQTPNGKENGPGKYVKAPQTLLKLDKCKYSFLTLMKWRYDMETTMIQVNLCQKLLFLHHLTQNMTADCSLNYKLNTRKFQAQTWGEHVVYRNCF
jgi:hypothetical protein